MFIDVQVFSSLFSSWKLNLPDEITDKTSNFQWASNQSTEQAPRYRIALWKRPILLKSRCENTESGAQGSFTLPSITPNNHHESLSW